MSSCDSFHFLSAVLNSLRLLYNTSDREEETGQEIFLGLEEQRRSRDEESEETKGDRVDRVEVNSFIPALSCFEALCSLLLGLL